MPSGRTHDAVTWLMATPVALSCWYVGQDGGGAALAAVSFTFAGLMFGGDLDVPSCQYRRWGKLRWLWKPYQWVVPHRSIISHGLFLGLLGRLLYVAGALLLCVVAAMRLFCGQWALPWEGFTAIFDGLARLDVRGWGYVGYTFVGLWLGGASHSLVDWGWSALKRWGH